MFNLNFTICQIKNRLSLQQIQAVFAYAYKLSGCILFQQEVNAVAQEAEAQYPGDKAQRLVVFLISRVADITGRDHENKQDSR